MPVERFTRPFPNIPQKEVLRYLGYKGHLPEERVFERIAAVTRMLRDAATPLLVRQRFAIEKTDEGIRLEGLMMKSASLRINLKPCEEAFLTAATLGPLVDRLMTRLSLTSSFDMVLLQALAAACLEEVLDEEEKVIRAELALDGLGLRPRYSPGYGDLPLDLQPDFIRLLNAGKLIGLSVTDSLMLTPQKSVTAITGICRAGEGKAPQNRCANCGKADCGFQHTQSESEG